MACMPKEVQDVFNAVRSVSFATATCDGAPNMCIVGMKKIIDDETIYLSDQFFKKTLANLRDNAKVSVLFYNEEGAYQVHGTARYLDEGAEFDELKTWADAAFEAKGLPIQAKGGALVHVDAVYTSASGPHAGDRIA